MISKVMRRMSAIMMAFVLVLTSMPMQSFGATATLADGKLSIEGSAVTPGSGSVTMTVSPKPNSGCTGTTYSENTTTATITNISGADGAVKFTYSSSGNVKQIQLNGATVENTGTYSAALAAGATISVSLTCNGGSSNSASLVLSGFELADTGSKSVTVLMPEAGTGTVSAGGEQLTETKSFTVSYEDGIQLQATPATGYQFIGWVDETQNLVEESTDDIFQPTADCTIKAVFVPNTSVQPFFKVGAKIYEDLNDAIAYASNSDSKIIVAVRDGIVPAGDYTVPSGVTLLVPFDQSGTCYTFEPGHSTEGELYVRPTVFRKLVLADGVNLNIEGTLSVSARHKTTQSGGQGSAPTGPCSFLEMQEGSNITVKDGGSLYVWGFVYGQGEIIAKSGSVVYENMQITDFRGGTATSSITGFATTPAPEERVFPFSQYYVQNIECPITFEYGAEEYAYVSVEAGGQITSSKVKFVGDNGAMFTLKEGSSVTKTYLSNKDRLSFDIDGDVELNSINLSFYLILTINLYSGNFNLPITNNYTINILSGTTTVGQDVALLPGSEIYVADGAKISLKEGNKIFVYDRDEWIWTDESGVQRGYTHTNLPFAPIPYSPTKSYNRTAADAKDVVLDINGSLEANGDVYTTAGGAAIVSSQGTGNVSIINGAGRDTQTYQYKSQTDASKVDLQTIPITSAKLQNADSSYTETAGSEAGTYFVYDKTAPGANGKNGKWVKATAATITYNANGGSGEMEAQSYSVEDVKNAILSGTGIKLKANAFTKTEHAFTNWNTEADGSGKTYANEAKLDAYDSVTLYAQWKINEYNVNFDSKGGSEVAPVTKAYGAALTDLPIPTREGFIFEGWYTVNDDEKVDDSMTMPSGGLNCYAMWNRIQYALGYELDGGSLPEGQMNPEGYNVESDNITLFNPTKEGYTFLGWKEKNSEDIVKNATIPTGTTGDKYYTAQWSVNQYEITFELENGKDAIKIKQDYNTAVTAPADPVKEGYTFTGWDAEIPATMPAGDMTITATWDANPYVVVFDGNGSTSGEMSKQDFTYDIAQNLLKNAFSRAYTVTFNYNGNGADDTTAPATATFNGWAKAAEEAKTFADEESVMNLTAVKDEEVKLYANWTLGTVTLPTPERTGYEFAGWSTDEEGKNIVEGETYTPETDKTLYAQWTANTYEVQFDGNGSTSGEMKNQAFTYDVAQDLTENAFVRQYTVTYDYNNADGNIGDPSAVAEATFNGWKTADTTYEDKDSVKNLTAEKGGVVTLVADWTLGTVHLPTPTRTGYDFDGWAVQNANTRSLYNGEYVPETDVTLVAQWTPIVYDITYDLDEELVGEGAALPEGTPTSYTIESEDFTLNHPTVEGYTFTGWTVEGFEEPQMTVVIEQGTIGDKTYKANWEINQHTVTYDALDGSEPQTITLNYGEEIPENVLEDTESHIFDGWFVTLPGEGEAEEPMPAAMPDRDLVVKAHWVEKEEVTLTFDTDGGSAVGPLIGYVGGKLTLPDAPEKTGHTFAGWFNEAGENVSEKENPRYPFENETYTAHWTVNSYQVSFDSDGGSAVDPIFVPYNTKAEAPETVPVKPGYTFQGWNSLPENMPAEDITVKAIWKANQFVTVTFNNHKGVPMMEFGDLHGKPFEKPEDPTRLGYEFAGWIDEEGNEYNLTIYPEKDMTFTATWTPIDYTITFDTDGGSTVAPMTLHYGDAITAPAEPTKEGYDFFAWYDVENEEYVNIPKTMPARDMNLKAVWSINQYTITFDTDGGSKVKPMIQDYGTAVTAPKTPEKEGYSFVGWEPALPETMPATDTAVKAVWEAVPYAIEYDLDGGVLADGYPTEYTIESEDLTLPYPAKEGYTFDGWTGSNGKRPEKDVTIKTGTTGDMSYKAQWTVNTYEVQFNGNGATSGEMNKQEFTYDVAQNLTENGFSRAYTVTFDYHGSGAEAEAVAATATFNGWAETAGGDKVYDDKQEVSNLATEGTYDLYANWTLGTVTLPTPEREGYEFAGWTAGEDGTGTIYDGGDTYTPVDDTTLYAQWTANTYEVQFDGNGATSGTMENQKFIYDAAQNLTENAFGREYTVTYNYNGNGVEDTTAVATATFNGWATAADGDKVYDDKQEVSNLAAEGTYDLYANWTLGTVTLPTPERTGYDFAGWTTDAEGKDFVQGETYTPEKDMTLYAQWTANEFDVHFDGNGATSGEMKNQVFTYDVAQNLTENAFDREYTVTYNYNGNGAEDTTAKATATFNGWAESAEGEKVYDNKQEVSNLTTEGTYDLYANWTLGTVTLPTPERTGYAFTGWTVNADGTGTVYNGGDVYTPVEDVTFYAQWSINKYTATFDANGGSEAVPVTITKDYGTELGELPTTVRPGHTFNGWFTAAEEGKFITADTKMPAGDVIYYAQWTLNKHTITFDSANGNPPVVIEQYYGTEAVVADAPEKEGHTFEGWNTKADGTGTAYEPGDKFELTENVELFAQWTVNQYKLSFDANGGSDVDPIEQDYGTEVTAPADPTRKGYTFAGWDGDIPETMPATDMTFTAKWNINQYTATFDDTEGSGHKETITQDYDTDVTVPEAPEREGYTFLNWNTEADGTGKDYKPGKKITLEDADITFYAQWSINQYTIKFDTDGGSDVAAMELDYGAEVKAPAEPSKYGYAFAGWEPALPETMPAEDLEVKAKWIELERYTATFTDHNGNTIDVSTGLAGEKIPVPADPVREGYTFAGWTPAVPETYPEANTTYTAQWTVNEYEATFDANGGVEAAPATITKDYAESLGKLPVTAREGYTFQGWFTEKTGGTKITDETTMPAGGATYYAQWAINTYTIEFDTAGGTEVSKIVQEFGTAIRKPAAPSKTGHTFIGWSPEVPTTMPAENMKLTAQWKANQYTIVFNTDGGSKVDPITQDYGTAITAPENPTKEGYSFAGWNTEIPTTMPAGNKLIKATWKINQYTIAFDTAGGSEVASITQDYGTKVTAPADPTRTDYAFAGWSVEIPKTMPAGDMTVTAQWEYIYTGWKTTDEGTTYFENGKQPYKNEFAVIDDVTYYFDEESYIVKGVTELEDGIYLFDQETGEFAEGDGLCEFDGDLYLLDDNKVVENAGLVKIDEDYYFFGEDHKAVKDQMVDVEDTKGYLPAGTYEFGPDGKMINVPVELTEEIVKLKDDSVVYDGTKKKPVVVVKGLDADAYEVTYADNLHAGTATVTVTGVKGCFGTVTLHFEITKAKNSWTEKLTIEGWTEGEKAQKPFADAQFGDVTYEFYADRNCTEKIAAPKAAGKYFVKAYVEGTEDYTGLESRAVKFIIDEPAKKPSDKPAGGAGGQDNDGNTPSTGDENQLTLWLGLAMASMMGAFSAYRRRRDEI